MKSDELKLTLDKLLEETPADDKRCELQLGERHHDPDVNGMWAESTEHGVMVYAQAQGIRLHFGMTRDQARYIAAMILRCAGGDA